MKALLEERIANILRILDTRQRLPGYRVLKLTKILPQLRRAIDKIAEGSYGWCDDCGEKIPETRLAVVPGSTRCIACQEKFERSLT
jgi:phage/conjugal plasmid C-4 type zinc finger TraR family protein